MTRKKVRKVWLRTCKQQGYLKNGNRKLRFIYYKRLSNMGLTGPVKAVLAILGESQAEFFEGRFMTVLHPVTGTTWIVTPVKIGNKSKFSCSQLLQVLAHELQHFFDFKGKLSRVAKYLNPLSGRFRAWMEGMGESAGADVNRYFKGPALAATAIFNGDWQNVYMCSREDAQDAQSNYNQNVAAHKHDQYATKGGSVVILIVAGI